jgi:hypothetical protein
MRISFLIAAGLAILLAGAHSYLGERYILIRLFRRDNLPKLFGGVEFTKQTLRFAWHITSIAWLGLASLLFVLAWSPNGAERTQARLIAAVFGFSGLAALLGSRGRHLSWVVFFAIAVLVWFGYP